MTDQDDLLNDLFQHPGWEVLRERYQARKVEDIQVMARTILYAKKDVDQKWVDETRGFWRGADYLLRETKNAAKAFQRSTIKDGEPA